MYGYPHFTKELERALKAGRLVLGGCVPGPDRGQCTSCGSRFPEPPDSP